MGLVLNHALFLDLDEETAIERIRERAKREDRKDDTSDEIINKRFEEYKEKTLPLVDFYEKSRKLINVKGDIGREEVLREASKKLKLKKS
jgi:adenylate kinase